MKNARFLAYGLIAMLLISVAVFSRVPSSFAASSDVTVTTDDTKYEPGDSVVIEGAVDGADEDENIEITVFDPDDRELSDVNGEVTTTNRDGEFAISFNLDDDSDEGVYQVKAVHEDGDEGFTYFDVADRDEDNDDVLIDEFDDPLPPGERVEISGNVPDQDNGEVEITVYGPDGRIIEDDNGDKVDAIQEDIDNDGNYESRFDLDNSAEAGRYKVLVEFGRDQGDTIFEVEDDDSSNDDGSSNNDSITVQTEESSYAIGDTVTVTGEVGDYISGERVDIKVTNPDGDAFLIDDTSVNSRTNEFSYDFDLGSEDVVAGTWKVKATYDGDSDEASFKVTSSSSSSSGLTVKTDKESYSLGDIITVTGKVPKKIGDQTVNIHFYIVKDNKLHQLAQVEPDSDLTYSYELEPRATRVTGDYLVKVVYGDNTAQDTFTVTGGSDGSTGEITVKTDRSSYDVGGTVTISGSIPAYLVQGEGQRVVITVNNPDNTVYRIDQAEVSDDGSYSYDLTVGGKLGIPGEYNVDVALDQQHGEGTFVLAGNQQFELKVDGKTYPISYEMSGGEVKSMIIQDRSSSLTVSVEATEDGKLTIELPRNVIDSLDENKGDKKYTVSAIDLDTGATSDVNVVEEQNAEGKRVLVIDYDKGTDLIQISGTQVVPEFGSIAVMVMAIAIIAIIAVTARFQGRLGFGNKSMTGL